MRKCQLCKKGSKMVGHRKLLRGHYNPTNWSRKYPNLQKFTTPKGEKVLACTSCIRDFSKEARIAANKTKRADRVKRIAEELKARLKARKAKKEKSAKDKEAQAKKKETKKPRSTHSTSSVQASSGRATKEKETKETEKKK